MNTLDEQIEILQALRDGKEIEQCHPNYEWLVLPEKSRYLFFNNTNYRIKPKPFEIYAVIKDNQIMSSSRISSYLEANYPEYKTIKLVEEIE